MGDQERGPGGLSASRVGAGEAEEEKQDKVVREGRTRPVQTWGGGAQASG